MANAVFVCESMQDNFNVMHVVLGKFVLEKVK